MCPRRSSAQRMRTRMPVATASARPRRARAASRCRRRRAARAPTRTGRSSGCLRSGSCTHAQLVTVPAVPTSTRSSTASPVSGSYSSGGHEHPPAGGPAAEDLPVAQAGEERADHRPDAAPVRQLERVGGLPRGHRRSRTHSTFGRHRSVWTAFQRSVAGPERTCSTAGMAFNLADLIEHTVDAVPDRTALICGDREETFAELEERANRLAHHLAAHGVGARRPRRRSTRTTASSSSRRCSRPTSCGRSRST